MEAIRRVSQTVAAPRLFVKAFSPTVAHGARLARSAALYSSEAEAAPRVALMFPGQGSQRLGMCAELAEEFSVAREVLQEVDEAVGAFVSRLMIHGPHDELVDTKNAQPAMLAHSVAAARVVEQECGLGIRHAAVECVLGHSVGEFAALVVAESLSLWDAARLLRVRGEAMATAVPPSVDISMVALVPTGRDAAFAAVAEAMRQLEEEGSDDCVDVANINSPSQVVISGTARGVELAVAAAKAAGVTRRAIPLKVSAPFHSRLMAPAERPLRRALAETNVKDPAVKIIMNADATPTSDAGVVSERLADAVCAPVQWEGCVAASGTGSFVELGPGTALAGLVRQCNRDAVTVSIGDDVDALRKATSAFA